VGKKGYEKSWEELKAVALRAQVLKDECLGLVDRDAEAFDKVMESFKLPKATEDQGRERDAAVEAATREATLVPLRVLEAAVELLLLARTAAEKGNRNSLSDAGVAALAGRAAADGGYFNVRINLPGLKDEAFKAAVRKQAFGLRRRAHRLAAAIEAGIAKEWKKR
jgi:glutamate formiminotransferase/formiminotetrahydrofolate cyclodeaminase